MYQSFYRIYTRIYNQNQNYIHLSIQQIIKHYQYTDIDTHTFTHTHTCMHTHTYTHTHTHARTHTHTHLGIIKKTKVMHKTSSE